MTTLEYYTDKAKDFCEGTVNVDMGALYQPFLELIPDGGKILDAGCGSGRDSKFFKDQGYGVVAFDYSKEIVKLASEYTGEPVLHMSFNEVEFENEFDGIWACASILHVPKNEISGVLGKLSHALKKDGILYTSFKYGDAEEVRKDRLFSDFTEPSFQIVLETVPSLKMVQHWKTVDARPDRKDEFWLNMLLQKV
jgi:SAM-dependent methyltransferase